VGDVSDETAYDKDATCVDLVDKDKSFFFSKLAVKINSKTTTGSDDLGNRESRVCEQ